MSEQQKICFNCGNSCDKEFKFCPVCGANLEEAKCANCGATLVRNAKFCVNCGAKVEDVKLNAASSDSFDDEENPTVVTDENKTAKPAKTKKVNKKFVLNLVKDITLVFLCLMMFSFSFCDIISVDADRYLSNEVEGVQVSISAVDCIAIMGATANANDVHERYVEEAEELSADLIEALKEDYNDKTGKFYLSKDTRQLISDYLVVYLKCTVSDEDSRASDMNTNFVLLGILCLMDILFGAIMLALSVCSLLAMLFKVKNKVAKFFYAMPMFLFLSLLCLFLLITTAAGPNAVIAGTMGANLFFEVLALLVTIAIIFVFSKKIRIKNAIPKLVCVAMSLIICGCMFAPFFTAKFDLVLQNRTKEQTYSASIGAEGLITFLSPVEIEDLVSRKDSGENVFMTYMDYIQMNIDNASESTQKEFDTYSDIFAIRVMNYIIMAVGDYNSTGAISIGYYILLFVFLLLGAFACWTISKLFKKSNTEICLFIVALGLIVISFACSVGLICMSNYFLEYYEISKVHYTIGGGAIAAIIMFIISLVFAGVFRKMSSKPKKTVDSVETLELHTDLA